MILRLWRGWTTLNEADRYEELIRLTIFTGILARRIDGFEQIELHRRQCGEEIEFVSFMWFASCKAPPLLPRFYPRTRCSIYRIPRPAV